MFHSNKVSTRRYDTEEAMKPSANVVSRARRALGDITNSFGINGDGQSKEANKKPTLVAPSSSVYPAQETARIDEEHDTIMRSVDDYASRPYMKRESDNIDARDGSNPLLCTTYINDMYDLFHIQEKQLQINANYMGTQPNVNERMRAILVDWLVDVHLKFKMVPETLYLTINIIDRYLEVKQVRRSKLQLVGVAALLAAAKYEEIYPPELKDLVYITDSAYNKHEIVEMESSILDALHYNFTVPTIHTFLCRHLKAAHADRAMVQLSCYLAERCMQEYSMVKYLPSVIAASSVLIARKSLKRHPWSPTLVQYTKYDEPDLEACIRDMKQFIPDAGSAQQMAVFRKYALPKFGAVSRMSLSF